MAVIQSANPTGNHELYLANVAYLTFKNFSTFWGDKYLTSNVQIVDPVTNSWEYVGKTHRYFTTEQGMCKAIGSGLVWSTRGSC